MTDVPQTDTAQTDEAPPTVVALPRQDHFGLRRLEIESFKCVESATVELGPGLNVLFGPNDLGKSSLGEAIRAALLLPATSSDRKAFEAWGAAKPPHVRLAFAHKGGLWRIDKTWGEGTRGTALLERSADGHVWSKQESGRSVDAELRKMLGWGVREPGGKGAPKGLPKSFITTALLGASSRIEELFGENLADDSDPAGRERLSEALQSLAEDPLFKRILTTAQMRVDASKDSRGNWRRGREAPLGRIAERIRELSTQYEGLVRQAEQSESIHEVLRTHQERRTALLEQLEAKRAERKRLQIAYDAGAVWRNAQGAIGKAREQLDAIDRDLARVERLNADAHETRAAATALIDESEAAAGERARAEEEQRVATLALAALERDDGALARVEALRRRELALQRDRQRISERRHQLAEAAQLDATAGADAQRATTASTAIRRAQQDLASIHDEHAAIDRELERVAGWLALLRWREAKAHAERTEQAHTNAKSLAARGRLMREAAARRRADLDRTPVPDPATLALLRELDARRRRAEDQTAVGFAVTFRPDGDHTATIVADGGESRRAGTGAHPALRDMTIAIGSWGTLQIEAGSAALRGELAAARERWDADAVPILAAHGAADLDALVQASAKWHSLAAQCQHDEQQAIAFERESAAGAIDDATLAAAREGLERATATLGTSDPAAMELEIGTRSLAEIALREAELSATRAAGRDRLAGAELARGLAAAQAEQLRAAADASAAKADAARRGLPAGSGHDLMTAIAERDDELAGIAQALAEVELSIASTADEGKQATTGARARLADATTAVAAAKAHQLDVDVRLVAARERAAGARARAEEAAASIATVSRDAVAAELERCIAQATGLSAPTAAVDPDALTAIAAELDAIDRMLADTLAEIQKAEGSLEQIGGPTMRRRADEAQVELLGAKQAESDLQREYEGWQLLRDTLRGVETEQGHHLGNALGGAVEARLKRLTDGRYGRLDLDRDLRAQGLRIAGSPRAIDVLSAGLKEQLATLVRLAIAEHLDSTVVLDDHLAQTDPDRVEFFRTLLREIAGRVQVIVLTCRPLDYLDTAELAASRHTRDVAASVRAIDLAQVIVRGTATSGS